MLVTGIFGNGQGPQTAAVRSLGYPGGWAEPGLFICLPMAAVAGGYQCRIDSALQSPEPTAGNFWYFSSRRLTTVAQIGFGLGFFFFFFNFIDFLC